MKYITIGFSRPKGKKFPIFSWGIRFFQGWTDYSHVYLKFSSNSLDRDIIYQASGTQLNFMGSKIFEDHAHMIEEFVLEINDTDYRSLLQFCIDNAGKPYSIRDILAILLKSRKLLDNESGFVCSNLMGYILQNYLKITLNKDYEMYTPKDIYSILKFK